MNKDLINYIKELSKKDKKSLIGKALKLQEEVGELAKVLLPYESQDGTNHRFVDEESLLDAIADVHLANISIGYSLGFTDEKINDMIAKKAEKWNTLQLGEEEAKFPLPYEIHVTVDASHIAGRGNEVEDFPLEKFKNFCKSIGVKPIVLDLEINKGNVMKDVMTSSKHFGNNRTAYEECKRISNDLKQYGYIVVREKIETVPYHPASPKTNGDKMPEDCYFESHIGCVITPDQKEELEYVSNHTGSHLSKNFFKKMENGKYVSMLTYRSYGDKLSVFQNYVEYIKELLNDKNIEYEKVIIEFSIYDTKVSHDFKWLNENK